MLKSSWQRVKKVENIMVITFKVLYFTYSNSGIFLLIDFFFKNVPIWLLDLIKLSALYVTWLQCNVCFLNRSYKASEKIVNSWTHCLLKSQPDFSLTRTRFRPTVSGLNPVSQAVPPTKHGLRVITATLSTLQRPTTRRCALWPLGPWRKTAVNWKQNKHYHHP